MCDCFVSSAGLRIREWPLLQWFQFVAKSCYQLVLLQTPLQGNFHIMRLDIRLVLCSIGVWIFYQISFDIFDFVIVPDDSNQWLDYRQFCTYMLFIDCPTSMQPNKYKFFILQGFPYRMHLNKVASFNWGWYLKTSNCIPLLAW